MPIKIKCDDVCKNLSAYYDKELDDNLYNQIQEHLRACITCRREFSNMAKMSYQMMKTFDKVEIPKLNIDIDKALQCQFVMENLDEYVDKELQKKDSSKISEHLLNCKLCRNDYEDLKNIKKVTRWYFSVFKLPSNVVNCRQIVNLSFDFSKKRVAWVSAACLAGVMFLMLLSAMLFAPNNINPPSVATKGDSIKKVIQQKHEIKVSNVKTIDVN